MSLHPAPLSDPVQREAFRHFFIDLATESSGKWLGLSGRPARWTWFSAHYKDVVRPNLTGQIQEHTTGILHSYSETPVLAEQIRESLPVATTWLPLAASIPKRLTDMIVPINSA